MTNEKDVLELYLKDLQIKLRDIRVTNLLKTTSIGGRKKTTKKKIKKIKKRLFVSRSVSDINNTQYQDLRRNNFTCITSENSVYDDSEIIKFEVQKENFNMKNNKQPTKHETDNQLVNEHSESKVREWAAKNLKTDNPKVIAQELIRDTTLNKQAIGDFLGSGTELSQNVYTTIIHTIGLKDKSIVDLLRELFKLFKFPLSAERVDHIIEIFTQEYCKLNNNFTNSPALIYMLCFEIFSLNTNYHDSDIEEKMKKSEFIDGFYKKTEKNSLPVEMLENIYEDVIENKVEFILQNGETEIVEFTNPKVRGWLIKQGGRIKTWKKRYFVLTNNCLYYYKSNVQEETTGLISLDHVQINITKSNCKEKRHIFEITSILENNKIKGAKFSRNGTLVKGRHKSYRLRSKEYEHMNFWVRHIQNAILSIHLVYYINLKRNEYKSLINKQK
ncbi:cytohesin 4a-related [Anaeramoeba flamelloides]|uniref:Cytohesin 4a-related n=1 Tax=Anaeramoeba flamelloides TaxID=1746091 RepID=A0ABQ8XH08_9EUKA|nr:cytohesin 4a-related [Anaeramoeba flamelloides]